MTKVNDQNTVRMYTSVRMNINSDHFECELTSECGDAQSLSFELSTMSSDGELHAFNTGANGKTWTRGMSLAELDELIMVLTTAASGLKTKLSAIDVTPLDLPVIATATQMSANAGSRPYRAKR